MNAPHRKLALAGAAMLLAGAAHAGVSVDYVDPDGFTDLPRAPWEKRQALADFVEHFQKLGAALRPGQDLRIDVLDIDLAGRQQPNGLGSDEIRILRGGADWPRMHLRYTLSEGGRVVASGDAELSDKAYSEHINTYPHDARWPYEMQMIDDWWRKTIGNASRRPGEGRDP